MRSVTFLLLFSFIYLASSSKSNVKALTEQMGQEVIELAGNLKGAHIEDNNLEERLILRIPVVKNIRLELPPDIDEEPSAESDEELKGSSQKTKSSTPGTTKKEVKKTVQISDKPAVDGRKRGSKDIDKLDSISQSLSVEEAEEEERIEKEFADLYKDNADYKSDSSELKEKGANTTKKTTNKDAITKTVAGRERKTVKPILRGRTNFKFQPDSYDNKAVEMFRTSIDEITCGNRVTKLAEQLDSSSSRELAGTTIIACNLVMLLNMIAST